MSRATIIESIRDCAISVNCILAAGYLVALASSTVKIVANVIANNALSVISNFAKSAMKVSVLIVFSSH